MKHIVIDARELRTSTGRYIERLLHYLQLIDGQPDYGPAHQYTVLLKPQDMAGWEPTNPNFTKLASPYKEFTFQEQWGLNKQIESLKPDLVHFAMVQQPVMYGGAVVTTMHDLTTTRFRNPAKNPLVFAVKQRVYIQVNKRVARKSQAIITPSEFVKQDVAKFCDISPDKITVTYEAADDLPLPAEPIAGLENKRFIMYVGRPTPHKNLERLINAFTTLQKGFPYLHLVLAGKKDDNYRRIEAMVGERNISRIIFTDFITDQQLRWLYQLCDAYVFPSLSEGFGLPGLEAMQHGAPVVSSNATCLPEIYGDAALYFDPLNATDIAAKITSVLTDPQLRKQLVLRGKQQAAQYSWQRMAEQTLGVYNSILGQ
jgi:glycosyltransferase involved in cell wall biosynthesis